MPATASPRVTWSTLSRRARMLVILTLCLGFCGSLEVICRTYWRVVHHVPFWRMSGIWDTRFPAFAEVHAQTAPERSTPGVFEVLVLGPSVWNPGWGDIASRFERGLSQCLDRPVRVSNLSTPAHTSFDAWHQYRVLDDRQFDLVVVYHGINDMFLNNIPVRLFRDDYSHASRFRCIQSLEQHPEHPYVVFPYTVRYLACRWQEQLRIRRQPSSKDFWAEGEQVKTGPAFRRHIEQIVALAEQRGAHVLLLTEPTYIPANYTEAAFVAGELDYAANKCRLSQWGSINGVTRGMDAHNNIIRAVADAHRSSTTLGDLTRLMEAEGRYFDDCCHFSPDGCARFTELLLANVDWRSLHATTAATADRRSVLSERPRR